MKILIIGCGFIGELHLSIIKKHNLSEVAVCESNPKRLKEISEKYKVKEVYNNIDGALKNNFNGVIICTPNNKHAEHVIKCIKLLKGLKAIFVEKPMAHTVADAKRMLSYAKENKIQLFIGYYMRIYDPLVKMKEMILNGGLSGQLGKIIGVRALMSSKRILTDALTDYRSKREFGGGIIHDLSHEIDYTKWLVGERVEAIYCNGFNLEHKKWDTFDTADIILKFENNKIGSIHIDYIGAATRRAIEIYGTKGTLLWSYFENIKFYSEGWARWYDIKVDLDFDKLFLDQLQNYIRCIKGEMEPTVSGDEGLEIVKIIEGCIKSADNNEIIVDI